MRIGLAREADRVAEQLEDALSSDALDEARALELAERIGDLRTQQFKRFVRSIIVVRRTLTPDQVRALTTTNKR